MENLEDLGDLETEDYLDHQVPKAHLEILDTLA